jgi:hypothetical protein
VKQGTAERDWVSHVLVVFYRANVLGNKLVAEETAVLVMLK